MNEDTTLHLEFSGEEYTRLVLEAEAQGFPSVEDLVRNQVTQLLAKLESRDN